MLARRTGKTLGAPFQNSAADVGALLCIGRAFPVDDHHGFAFLAPPLAFVQEAAGGVVLSLPESERKRRMPTAAAIVVIFSTILQGLTLAKLADRVGLTPDLPGI